MQSRGCPARHSETSPLCDTSWPPSMPRRRTSPTVAVATPITAVANAMATASEAGFARVRAINDDVPRNTSSCSSPSSPPRGPPGSPLQSLPRRWSSPTQEPFASPTSVAAKTQAMASEAGVAKRRGSGGNACQSIPAWSPPRKSRGDRLLAVFGPAREPRAPRKPTVAEALRDAYESELQACSLISRASAATEVRRCGALERLPRGIIQDISAHLLPVQLWPDGIDSPPPMLTKTGLR
eukprot:TRINITY_DN55383_c0_g1_i1.p1 TRINITY_DN55383_c0_g1~~TRINITY_DN55383_c0_g1_i1.p1  ORF type:complete len:239 (+),score=25.94 TRINITY_DN55383_c0_g1_i1:59-775(+)